MLDARCSMAVRLLDADHWFMVPGRLLLATGSWIFKGIRLLTPGMKLHEIEYHFREVPPAVREYRLRRRRPRTRRRPL